MVRIFLIYITILTHFVPIDNSNRPVLLIHGFGGSQMEMKLNQDHRPRWFCARIKDWFLAWMSFTYDIIEQSCFFNNFKMIYDKEKNMMVNQKGVDIRPVGIFGSIGGIRYLDPALKKFTSYFEPIINLLETKFRYREFIDLFSAAYDFRDIFDVRKTEDYSFKLKILIETIKNKTNKSVILVTHSLGGVLTSHFLNKKTKIWKDAYIDSWYSISAPFGGSTRSLQSVLYGQTFGIPQFLISLKHTRELSATHSTVYFIFPSPSIFKNNTVFVKTKYKEYKVGTLREEISAVINPDILKILSYIPDVFVKQSPDVYMVCAYGTLIPTASKLSSSEINLINNDYSIEYENGDGTVDLKSLRACKNWVKGNSYPIKVFELKYGEHVKILSKRTLHAHFENFIKLRSFSSKKKLS